MSKRVIATGHHLEWLSIAPIELHPPRGQILKAADWLIANVEKTPQDEIDANYTFYSHVGKPWRCGDILHRRNSGRNGEPITRTAKSLIRH